MQQFYGVASLQQESADPELKQSPPRESDDPSLAARIGTKRFAQCLSAVPSFDEAVLDLEARLAAAVELAAQPREL